MLTADLRTWLIANVAAVSALGGDKVHINQPAQGAELDHVVITRLGEDPFNSLAGAAGLKSAEIDIDCKADTPDAAAALAEAIRAALEPHTGTTGGSAIKAVILDDTKDWHEPAKQGRDIDQHVTTLEFTVQYE